MSELVSKLVFYAQSTSMVISGRDYHCTSVALVLRRNGGIQTGAGSEQVKGISAASSSVSEGKVCGAKTFVGPLRHGRVLLPDSRSVGCACLTIKSICTGAVFFSCL